MITRNDDDFNPQSDDSHRENEKNADNLTENVSQTETSDLDISDLDGFVMPEVVTSDAPVAAAKAEAQAKAQAKLTKLLLDSKTDDMHNARIVAALHPHRFRVSGDLGVLEYMPDTGEWRTEGAESALNRAVVETLEQRIKAAFATEDPTAYGNLISKSAPNSRTVRGIIDRFQHIETVNASVNSFNPPAHLLNVANGVIDLRTGELLPHDPAYGFRYCIRLAYRPDADQSAWVRWLRSAVGEATAAWMKMAVGYSLTGSTREEVLFYLYGPPRSGKGTFTETIMAVLGKPLATEIGFETFTAQRDGDSQNFDLAPLQPCRLVAASESNQHERFNEAKLKRITGGNEITCAFKHRNHFSYRPQFKIWLSSNHPINADPDDVAVWGRIRLIDFPNSHLGEEDKALKEGMLTPAILEGVLAWAVVGTIEWYALGSKGLPELEAAKQTKQEQRNELDMVGRWLEECTTAGEFTTNASAYASYQSWCKDNGVEPKKQKGLTLALKHKGYVAGSRKVGGKTQRGYSGLSFA